VVPDPQQSVRFSNFQDDLRQVSAQPRGLTLPNTEPRSKRDGLDGLRVVHRRPFNMMNDPLPPLANLSASMAAKLAIEMRRSTPIGRVMTSTAGPVSQDKPRISYTSVQKSFLSVELTSQRFEGDHRESRSGRRYHCRPGSSGYIRRRFGCRVP
jgi:hypothetical protein